MRQIASANISQDLSFNAPANPKNGRIAAALIPDGDMMKAAFERQDHRICFAVFAAFFDGKDIPVDGHGADPISFELKLVNAVGWNL